MYAGFGKIADDDSLQIIKQIEESAIIEDEKTGKLKDNIVIKKATVETYGKEYKVKKIN